MHAIKIYLKNTGSHKYILLVFAFIFTFFATSRSIIPGLSFSAIAILWLLYNFPFYYHKKIILYDDKNTIILLFCFIICISGAIHYGYKYSNANIINLLGSITMYFILISLINDYQIFKKLILIHIIVVLPIVLVMAYRSWFHFQSLWLSPYWNNNYALGKNTVGFFLVFCFNYLYSYFIYRKTIIKFLGLLLLAGLIFYTVSRGALVSLVIIIIFTPFISKRKGKHIKSIFSIILSYFLIVLFTGVNPLYTFMEIKARGRAEFYGFKYDKKNPLFFLKFKNKSNSFGGEYGLSQRASHYITTAKNFKYAPFFGQGSGSFRRNEGTLAHNDYLNLLYEYGFIGLILFLIICWQHFYGLYKIKLYIPNEYTWLAEAQIVQLAVLFFTFLTVDAYMLPFTWYIFAGSAILINISKNTI
jgi:hypothetical protein